jgi:hypothetical protein
MTSAISLPVWVYWEGPKPAWIQACVQTQRQHWGNVRELDPEEWHKLWGEDRDLEEKITSLCISHKADIIRAYLISRYGGLWIDADCIAFRNLRPIMALVDKHEFVCFPQFDKAISAAFVGSRPGGRIASAWYDRQIEILRNNEPIQWLTFGSDALMHAIWKTQQEYFRMENDVISPVWWNDPAAFFAQRTDDEHTSHLAPEAFCYMLSNNMIQGVRIDVPLMSPDTFFSFLLRCSSQNVGASPISVKGRPHRGNY